MTIEQLIFVGFNQRVAALDRDTGSIVWSQKCKGGSYVTFLLEDDRLIVSSDGYIYCLNPLTGQLFWNNDMPGYGSGVASLISVRGSSSQSVLNASAQNQARQSSDSSSPTTSL
jgi:outer membrane protein assembly factor BamB